MFNDAKAKGLAVKLDRTKGRMIANLTGRIEKSTATQHAEWATRVEKLVGDPQKTLRYFREIELRPVGEPYFRAVEDLIVAPHLAPAEVTDVLLHSVKTHVDGERHIRLVLALARRDLPIETIRMLLTRAHNNTLDLQWLATARFTDLELAHLGGVGGMPWNTLKLASEHGRAGTPVPQGADISIDMQLRGVAGELVARDVELPHGFKLRNQVHSETVAADFEIVNAAGEVAELEVKSELPDSFLDHLRKFDPDAPDGPLKRLDAQLAAAHAKGRKAYVAVPEGLSAEARDRLAKFVGRYGVPKEHILYMPESEIQATASRLRSRMDISAAAPRRTR
jgi:hypothetical protein